MPLCSAEMDACVRMAANTSGVGLIAARSRIPVAILPESTTMGESA